MKREKEVDVGDGEVTSMLVRASESLGGLLEKMISKNANKELVQDKADFDGMYDLVRMCLCVMCVSARILACAYACQ
jgi:hypothetical protein